MAAACCTHSNNKYSPTLSQSHPQVKKEPPASASSDPYQLTQEAEEQQTAGQVAEEQPVQQLIAAKKEKPRLRLYAGYYHNGG